MNIHHHRLGWGSGARSRYNKEKESCGLNVVSQVVDCAVPFLSPLALPVPHDFRYSTPLELRSGRRLQQRPSSMSHDEHANAGPSTVPAPMGTPSCLVTTPQKDPPMFAGLRGDDVEEWLEQYDRVGAINHWDDPAKLTHVAFYLTGVAKTWYFNHELDFVSWASFKQQLRQIFANPSIRSDIAKKKLAERVQQTGESYTSYIEDVLALCRRVNTAMTETDRVRHLLKGIGAAAFNALVVKNPTTVSDIVATCQRLDELHLLRLQPETELRATNDSELRALIRSIIREELQTQATSCAHELRTTHPGSSLRDVVREELVAMTGAQVPTPPPYQRPIDPLPTPTYAQVAALASPPQPLMHAPTMHGSVNVLSPRTPLPPPNVWRPPRPVCYYCGIRGHISRFCRRRQQDERRGYDYYERDEFSAPRPQHSRPYQRYERRSPSPPGFNGAGPSHFSRRRSPSPMRRSSSPLRPATSSSDHRPEN